MSATALKIIGLICMTLDHCAVFLGAPLFFRYIGRIAAVLFFFCAAESAVKTRSRKKYMLRIYKMSLLMAALDVVIPFILGGWFPSITFPVVRNNIFSSIFQGVWIIDILESTKNDHLKRRIRFRNYILYQVAVLAIITLLDSFLNIDVHITGTILASLFTTEGPLLLTFQIPLFYCLSDSKRKLTIGYLLYCAAYSVFILSQIPARFFWFMHARFYFLDTVTGTLISLLGYDGMAPIYPFRESLLHYNYQVFMCFALPFLLLYNKKRGKGWPKFFYAYYPAHIMGLYLVGTLFLHS